MLCLCTHFALLLFTRQMILLARQLLPLMCKLSGKILKFGCTMLLVHILVPTLVLEPRHLLAVIAFQLTIPVSGQWFWLPLRFPLWLRFRLRLQLWLGFNRGHRPRFRLQLSLGLRLRLGPRFCLALELELRLELRLGLGLALGGGIIEFSTAGCRSVSTHGRQLLRRRHTILGSKVHFSQSAVMRPACQGLGIARIVGKARLQHSFVLVEEAAHRCKQGLALLCFLGGYLPRYLSLGR